MQLLSRQHSQCVDVAGTGFTVLDRIYTDGGLADEALGGSCGNVLVSLAMLHRNVAPVLALGLDDAGDRLVSEFTEAGANVDYIHQRLDLKSPILAQELDTSSGQHAFSFICPETNADLPRYQPIGDLRTPTCTADANTLYRFLCGSAVRKHTGGNESCRFCWCNHIL